MAEVDQYGQGCHWVAVILTNLDSVNWTSMNPKVQCGSARIYVFDSLRLSTSQAELGVVQGAITEFVAQAAQDRHNTSLSESRDIAKGIPWENVRFCRKGSIFVPR